MSGAGDMVRDERRAALAEALGHVAGGDRDALQVVYKVSSRKLLGIILHIVRDRDTAEDVLQEVYLKVWNRAGRFDASRASPITWLAAIARNSAIDAVRRVNRRGEVADDALPEIADEAPDADTMLCDIEDSKRLRECMDGLQEDHRRSIRMAFFRGFTHAELSERLDVPLGTMKSWIRRGLASLKGCLGDG
ncbi:MAG: sigma-70 family RNA polymerase sigma factor [Alteraurantiacibacter sp.]